jgi:hypothetical protein
MVDAGEVERSFADIRLGVNVCPALDQAPRLAEVPLPARVQKLCVEPLLGSNGK